MHCTFVDPSVRPSVRLSISPSVLNGHAHAIQELKATVSAYTTRVTG